MSFKREMLGGGVSLSRVTDERFKSCSVKITFTVDNSRDCPAKCALLFAILATSNSRIPTREGLLEECEGLYGSYISSFCQRLGDRVTAGLSCGFIGDRFTIDREVISTKITGMLLDCLFEPYLPDGKLSEEYFLMKQKELADDIAASINNKRLYAIREARKLIFKDEPAMYSDYGQLEDAMKITREDLLEFYHFLLDNAQIDVSVASDATTSECEEMIKSRFESLTKRSIDEVAFRTDSPCKAKTLYASENAAINQSKMVMAFKSGYEDIYVAKLLSTIYGGSHTSKLFENVREKLSLCYYCPSVYIDTKGTLLVDSGVETENIEAARDEIIAQLDGIAKGGFTDEELDDAKMSLCDGFMSNYDSPYDMQDWFWAQLTRGTAFCPDEICERINAVTREQIEECAASFRLDTVYTLRAVSEEAAES